ncbi:MAG: hypothetical protein GY765_43525 [bacterium]|nr:hypothetical protein [bacterium]
MSNKKLNIFLSLLILTMLWIPLQAEKLMELPEVLKPDQLIVHNNRVIVSQGPNVFVYSLKDLKLIKKFGKEGEGPKEFKITIFGPGILVIFPMEKDLVINSTNKLSHWSYDGEFISESKSPMFTVLSPAGDGYIGNGVVQTKKNQMLLSVTLFDNKMKKGKELYVSDRSVGRNASFHLPRNLYGYGVHKDKVFVYTTTLGFALDVYDLTGKKLYEIRKDYKELPITSEFKKTCHHWYKDLSPFKQYYNAIKNKITFKNTFPALYDVQVFGDRIYALTYLKKDGKRECIVMDLKGKELKRVFLPIFAGTPEGPGAIHTYEGNTFYTLKENEEEETWELLKIVID